MKYKAKFSKYERLTDEDLLNKLLIERGVEDPFALLNVDESVLVNAKKLKDIDKGSNLIDKYVKGGGKICIIVD